MAKLGYRNYLLYKLRNVPIGIFVSINLLLDSECIAFGMSCLIFQHFLYRKLKLSYEVDDLTCTPFNFDLDYIL